MKWYGAYGHCTQKTQGVPIRHIGGLHFQGTGKRGTPLIRDFTGSVVKDKINLVPKIMAANRVEQKVELLK